MIAKRLLVLMGALFCASSLSGNAAAQTEPLTAEYDDWVLNCQDIEGGLPCQIRHRVVDANSETQVLAFSIVFSTADNAHGMQLTLPLDFLLRPGVSIAIDDYQVDGIEVSYCDANGCYVEARLEQVAIDAFRTGNTGHIHMTVRDGRRIGLPFSLAGFNAAEKKLRIETASRTE